MKYCFAFLILILPISSFAGSYLRLEGGYFYSQSDWEDPTGSISLLANTSTKAQAELGFGKKRFDIFFDGGMSQETHKGSANITLVNPAIAMTEYGGGIRFKFKIGNIFLKAFQKDILIITQPFTNQYELFKHKVDFAATGFRFVASENKLKITTDAMIAAAYGSLRYELEDIRFNYLASGAVRVEYGKSSSFGFAANVSTQRYTVGQTDYIRNDFMFGLTLTLGSESSGGGGGSSSSGGGGNDGWVPPPWPFSR